MLASKSRPCGGRVRGSENDGRGWSAGGGGVGDGQRRRSARERGNDKKNKSRTRPCMKKPGEPGGAPIFFLTRSWEFRAGRSSRARTLGGGPARVRASVRGALVQAHLIAVEALEDGRGATLGAKERVVAVLLLLRRVARDGEGVAHDLASRRGVRVAPAVVSPRAVERGEGGGARGRRAAPSREARVPRVARLGRVDPERSRASEGPRPREDVAKRVGHRRSASFRCSSPSDQA